MVNWAQIIKQIPQRKPIKRMAVFLKVFKSSATDLCYNFQNKNFRRKLRSAAFKVYDGVIDPLGFIKTY